MIGSRFLRWEDVDPRKHPRPIASDVRAAVVPIVEAAAAAKTIDRFQVECDIDGALIARFGPSVSGWHWATSDGGPVQGWCCASHSVLPDGEKKSGAEPTIERVITSVLELRDFLEDLAARFDRLGREWYYGSHGHKTDAEAVECAAVDAATELLPMIIERTDAHDAWYATFSTVLGWYMEEFGCDAELIQPTIDELVSGYFTSWVAPSPERAEETCWAVAEAVAALENDATSPPRDGLASWLKTRESPTSIGRDRVLHDRVAADGHRKFIEEHDRKRDPLRAQQMTEALRACRWAAKRKEKLDFARLSEWQSLVLGTDGRVPFRDGDAFAHKGREIYPLRSKTPKQFEACLEQATSTEESVALRAARVYLDVCFFHPFPDGNARAARLALDYVITREGLAISTVEPLFLFSRSGMDRGVLLCLAQLLKHLLGTPP